MLIGLPAFSRRHRKSRIDSCIGPALKHLPQCEELWFCLIGGSGGELTERALWNNGTCNGRGCAAHCGQTREGNQSKHDNGGYREKVLVEHPETRHARMNPNTTTHGERGPLSISHGTMHNNNNVQLIPAVYVFSFHSAHTCSGLNSPVHSLHVPCEKSWTLIRVGGRRRESASDDRVTYCTSCVVRDVGADVNFLYVACLLK